jgi:branched-chain amino acid transport system permease protein
VNATAGKALSVVLGAAAVLVFLVAASPSNYVIFIFTTIFMYACLATSLDMLVGLAGRMSFCHAAFFGIGSYAAALAMIHWHYDFAEATVLAALVTAVIALPIGMLTIRLNGMYFALGTTALGISFISVIELPSLSSSTGGATGLVGIPTFSYLNTPDQFCVMFLIALGVILLIKVAVSDSRIGSRLRAVRDDEELALTLGVKTNRFKVFAFVLAAVLAGAIGSCFAVFYGSIAPADFDIWSSFNIVVWVLVGGAATLYGPLLGVALLWTVPQLLNWNANVDQLLYGLLLIVSIMFARGGIVGLFTRLYRLARGRWDRWRPSAPGREPAGSVVPNPRLQSPARHERMSAE